MHIDKYEILAHLSNQLNIVGGLREVDCPK